MNHLYKNKIVTSLTLITIVTFQPTISFAKEDPISNFFTKIFSSKSYKTNQSIKTQIFKSDISSLKLNTLIDFEFSIQDILKNYLDRKNINNVLNNISDKDDKNLNADSLVQFDNLLPKSKTDKINGKAILRLAKKIGKDENTVFEIKKNIILQVVASQGVTLVFSDKFKKTEITEVEKKDDIDIKEASSSYIPIIGVVAGLAAIGGGGGGSSSSVSDGSYRNTISGDYGTEYSAQAGLASVNSLGLNDYGYTGAGIKVSVVDSGIDKTHAEFDGRTVYGKDFSSSSSGYGYDENGHGSHVASIIAGERDASGIRGVAYDSTLYDYKWLDSSGSVSFTDAQLANMVNQHVTDNINVSNNSWGSSTRVNAVNSSTVTSTYAQTIAAVKTAQSNGTLFVFSAGNTGSTQPNLIGGMPYHDSDIAGAWLVVIAVDPDLTETAYTDRCGVTYDFCVTAPGGGDNQSTNGIYAAQANGSYVRYSGTSMAAPHVSGLAAALMEKFPSLTATQIATRIKSTASYDGLTGYSGQTSENSSTAVLQAIFGHGLINSTAAAARIGNYIYANGNNLSNGVDLSASKISLPASLPASTQNQILAGKFIVFDSFDGARFSINGSDVFKTSNSSTLRTYGNVKKIDTQTDPKFAFTSTGEKINHSKWSPRYITTGNSNEMSTADGFWGNTASLFSSSSMFQGQTLTNFIWSDNIGNIVIQPFFQIQDTQGSSESFSGYGASFHLNVNEGLKAVAGYKMSNQQFNNSIISDITSIGNSRDFELGFIQDLSSKDNFFLRFSNSEVQDLNPSDKTFGFKDIESDSWTIGYETNNKFGSFAFGLSKPNELSSGTLSLITPTGRSNSGDILYTETEFKVSSENKLERFFAYQHEKDNLALSFGVVESRYNYGNIGATKLDISYHF